MNKPNARRKKSLPLLEKNRKNYYTECENSTTGDNEDETTTISYETSAIYLEAPKSEGGQSYTRSTMIEEFIFQAKASIFSSSINIINANIGSGVLGLPFAVENSGWLMGILLFVVFAFMSTFAFQLLMSVGSCYVFKDKVASYAIVCNDIAPRLQILIDLFVVFGYTLTCTTYLIIIGDYMPLVAQQLTNMDADSDNILNKRAFWIFAFLICLIIPTTMLKKLDHLRFSSMISVLCFIYIMFIAIVYALVDGFDIEDDNVGQIKMFPTSTFSFFESAPLYIFAYGGHPLAFILTNELENPTLKRINITLMNAFSFVTMVYAVVGLCGYFTFGDATKTNILLNYPNDATLIVIVRIGLSIAVAFSYPVLANPWKQSMASLVFRIEKEGKDANDLVWYKYYLLVAILVGLTVLIAMLTDDLGIVARLQGATAGTFLQIIAPGLIYIYYAKLGDGDLIDNAMHDLKLKGAIFLIVFGCIMIPFGTTLVFL